LSTFFVAFFVGDHDIYSDDARSSTARTLFKEAASDAIQAAATAATAYAYSSTPTALVAKNAADEQLAQFKASIDATTLGTGADVAQNLAVCARVFATPDGNNIKTRIRGDSTLFVDAPNLSPSPLEIATLAQSVLSSVTKNDAGPGRHAHDATQWREGWTSDPP
jgi:hypothetical protein